MGNKTNSIRSVVFIIGVLILLLIFNSCVSESEEYLVTWKDADGSLIEYCTVSFDYDPSTRELPSDSDQWHYTEWNIVKSGNRIECIALRIKKVRVQWIDSDGSVLKEEYVSVSDAGDASFPLPKDSEEWHYTEWIQSSSAEGLIWNAKRVPKERYVWKDADGTVLTEISVVEGQEATAPELPVGNEKWDYVEWDADVKNGVHIFTAVKKPKVAYFVGNVFQIVVKDTDGSPLCTGSGFVINDEGWFITNNHVMSGGSSAVAFFDIKDQENGSRYTQLEVLGGVYNSEDKDIFIGKLDGYEKIKSYYNEITFTEEYETGEKAYTIGYPNSSVQMEINAGVILEEYSDIYDKINGIYYILSNSYIAPGSSGGILVNEHFDVIGITTIGLYEDEGKQIYRAGGSIPAFVFAPYLNNLEESQIKALTDIYK